MMGDPEVRSQLRELLSRENADNWWKSDLFEKYIRPLIPVEIEVIAPPPAEGVNYNCFVYALGLEKDDRFLGMRGWDFTRELDVLFEEMVTLNVLRAIDRPNAGDLIIYRNGAGEITHVGIMESEDVVVSKWSWGPLLRHKIFSVPDFYGDEVVFYAASHQIKNFVVSKYFEKK